MPPNEPRETQDDQLMNIVATALKMPAEERLPFLRSACLENEPLYLESLEILRGEERMGNFLQQPVISLETSHHDGPFHPGDLIVDRFEIIRKLGEGGMGTVYEALDRKRRQRIAIKAAKPGYDSLLTPELEGALKVRHSNICLVNEIHTTPWPSGPVDFLSMELLDGESLSAMIDRQGRLSNEDANTIALQLCAGLKAAHESGVIHRDLKASNVIVCATPNHGLRAVITDFGLCGEAARNGFFGTPSYLAPELRRGHKATPATDIFALGMILYEMVAGRESCDLPAELPRPGRAPSNAYRTLTEDFLSAAPERRTRAFAQAQEKLAHRPLSRREWLGLSAAATLTAATGAWAERESITNWMHPLPAKRHVALVAWPQMTDLRMASIVGGAIDAIGNELSRAEAADNNLLIVSGKDLYVPTPTSQTSLGWFSKLGGAVGVNLALGVSAALNADGFELILRVLSVPNGSELRKRHLDFGAPELGSLAGRAVQAVAKLLDVSWNANREALLNPTTSSVPALQAFQNAELLRSRPNDSGLADAIEKYNKAIDADPRYTQAYARLAMALLRQNEIQTDPGVFALAKVNAQKAIELDARSADGHLALASVFRSVSDFEHAQQEMRTAAKLDPSHPKLLPWQANLYRESGHLKEASETYQQLLRARPNYWVAYNQYGSFLAETGQFTEAIDAFRIAAAAAPGWAMPQNNLGALLFRVGKLAEAEECYRRSLKINPNRDGYSNLGELLRIRGKRTEALATFQKAIDSGFEDDLLWLNLADCYDEVPAYRSQAKNAYRKASALTAKKLQVNPADPKALVSMALCELKIGDRKRAMVILSKPELEAPQILEVDVMKARTLEVAGMRKQALAVIASAFRRGQVEFEIKQVKDFSGLLRDPRYLAIRKAAGGLA